MDHTSKIEVFHMQVFSAAIDDFTDTDNSYEFIYHDNQDLLLTIHGDSCYYAYVRASGEEENQFLIKYMHTTERYIEHMISRGDSRVHSSDLDTMRVKFQDLLADFRCLDKNIYSIQFNLEDVEDLIDMHQSQHSGSHSGHPHGGSGY